jgi:hypothetical protein
MLRTEGLMSVEEVHRSNREIRVGDEVLRPPAVATKAFAVYWWDTFDPAGADESLIAEADTLEEAEAWVLEKFGDRIRSTGLDRIQIAGPDRKTLKTFPVG